MKFVILDRDGVINADSPAYIKSVAEWQPIPGSIDALARLSQAGFELIVATNQSGLSRGLFDLDDLEAIHQHMRELVEQAGGKIGAVFYCPHLPQEHCNCRKPATGLLDAAETEYGCSVGGSFLVGDSLKDVELARRKGCIPILVRSGNGLATQEALGPAAAEIHIVDDLAAAARVILDEH
jgi:D-glycero-D-manno-heptose 1,7-bisphosphate phosphatase